MGEWKRAHPGRVLAGEDEAVRATLDTAGEEWTQELDDECKALVAAILDHRAGCADEDCECRRAVTR